MMILSLKNRLNGSIFRRWVGPLLAGANTNLYNLGKYEEAITYYDKAIQIDPNYAFAWRNKGLSLNMLGNYEEAISCYDKAIELDPDYVGAWNDKGLVFDKSGRYEEAITCYDRALDVDSGFVDALNNKGSALLNLGRHKEAIEYYDKALKISPDYVYAWNARGVALENIGEYNEAMKCFDKAVELDPNYLWAWCNKGISLEKLKKYEEAIIYFDKTLNINPEYTDAWNAKGFALESLGRHEEALRCYDRAIELAQDYSLTWINKGNSLRAIGRYNEAEQCYTKAQNLDPYNVVVLDALSTFYSEYLYDQNKALKIDQKALEISPDDISIRASYAEVLIKAGEYSQGRQYALQILNETQDVVYKCVMKFLVYSSYFLEGYTDNAMKEFVSFLDYYRSLDADFKIEEDRWLFKGLIHAISQSSIRPDAKFILLTLINLLEGRIEKHNLSFFGTSEDPKTSE